MVTVAEKRPKSLDTIAFEVCNCKLKLVKLRTFEARDDVGVEVAAGGRSAAGGLLVLRPSFSSCLVAHSARPRTWRDSAVLMKDASMFWGTLASPLYMYSTRDFKLSKSTSFMNTTGCLSFNKLDLNRVCKMKS